MVELWLNDGLSIVERTVLAERWSGATLRRVGCSVAACCGGSALRHIKYPKSTNLTPCTSLQHCLNDGAGRDLLRHINDTSTIHQRYFDDISTIYNGRNMIEVSSINSRNDSVGCLMERC